MAETPRWRSTHASQAGTCCGSEPSSTPDSCPAPCPGFGTTCAGPERSKAITSSLLARACSSAGYSTKALPNQTKTTSFLMSKSGGRVAGLSPFLMLYVFPQPKTQLNHKNTHHFHRACSRFYIFLRTKSGGPKQQPTTVPTATFRTAGRTARSLPSMGVRYVVRRPVPILHGIHTNLYIPCFILRHNWIRQRSPRYDQLPSVRDINHPYPRT